MVSNPFSPFAGVAPFTPPPAHLKREPSLQTPGNSNGYIKRKRDNQENEGSNRSGVYFPSGTNLEININPRARSRSRRRQRVQMSPIATSPFAPNGAAATTGSAGVAASNKQQTLFNFATPPTKAPPSNAFTSHWTAPPSIFSFQPMVT
jgi:hypothetical protein